MGVLLFVAIFAAQRGSADFSMAHSGDQGFLAAFPVLASIALMQGLGAVLMLRLRCYPLAATTSILAMIPLSPAFFISLPVGIWACIVLGKPEVTEAFYDPGHSPVDEPAEGPDPRPHAGSLFLSYMRSVAGYFLPTMAGRTRNDAG
jgi:hypothetical protein